MVIDMKALMQRSILAVILATSTMLIAWPGTSMAIELQDAKSQLLVGEKADGYLGVVKSSPEVIALVNRINKARRQHYEDIAKRNGTSVDVVEKLAGKKAIDKTPSGQYVQLPPGSWVRK
jgi:uncharacterized protein YdbL (DUF1318 family)